MASSGTPPARVLGRARLLAPLVLVALGCDPGAASSGPVDAAVDAAVDPGEVCRELLGAIHRGRAECCGIAANDAALERDIENCLGMIGPVITDPRFEFDLRGMPALLEGTEERYSACDPRAEAWTFSVEGLYGLFAGTLPPGAPCGSTELTDTHFSLACVGGHCDTLARPMVCAARRRAGEPCQAEQDCEAGLVCDRAEWATSGTCTAPLAVGEACGLDSQCESGTCSAAGCAPLDPRSHAPYCPAPADPGTRGLELALVGLPVSSTREVRVRLVDEDLGAVHSERLVGVERADATHRVPRAVPGTAYTAQIWTFDPARPELPTQAMETWVELLSDPVVLTFDGTSPGETFWTPPFEQPSQRVVLEASGFDAEVGHTVVVLATDEATGVVSGRARLAAVPGAAFRIELPEGTAPRVSPRVDVWVDVDDDDVYDPPPVDHSWTFAAVPATDGGFVVSATWSDAFVDLGL
jgi:hypothetical protein